jgi:hypothetical protein
MKSARPLTTAMIPTVTLDMATLKIKQRSLARRSFGVSTLVHMLCLKVLGVTFSFCYSLYQSGYS